jgi:hypothetical protein
MDVETRLREEPLPGVSVNTDRALAATTLRGQARRTRRSVALGVCGVVAVLGLAAAAVELARDDERTDLATGPSEGEVSDVGVWRPIAPSPLSARDQGIAVWTGSEVVIAGGSDTTPCPVDSRCLTELEPIADGGAYDPAADRWRAIADAPQPFVGGDAAWTGTQVLVLAHPKTSISDNSLMGYDPAADRWTVHADPPVDGLQSMTWTGDSWVGITSHGTSDETAWRYQPDTDVWEALPPDPMGQLSDRAIVWTGRAFVLLGSRYDQPGESANGQWQAAVLGVDQTWHELPASKIENNGGTWSAIDGLVVNPGNGPVDDVETGGLLDPTMGTWSPVPPDSSAAGTPTSFEGPAGRWVADDYRLFDPVAREWHAIEERGDEVDPAVAAWTGSEIVTWGGAMQHEASGQQLVATGAAYRPPGGSAPTVEAPTTTTHAEPDSAPEPGDAAVWDVDPAALPSANSTSFTANVSRLGCNGGMTGTVLRPGVRLEETRIVITFTVEADPDGGDCPSNDWVPYQVDLGEPIGSRALVDGSCIDESEAATTSHCSEDAGIRWPRSVGEQPPPTTFTVTGRMISVGGPIGSSDDPAPGTITAANDAGVVFAQVQTEDDGRFEISLAPGTYLLTGRSSHYQSGQVDCEAEGEVVVVEEDLPDIGVLCQRR